MKANFRAKQNADIISGVMTRPVTFPADGVVDDEYLKEVQESMIEWYNSDIKENGTNAEREEDIENAINNFYSRTGVMITKPVLKPIEVKRSE